MRIVIAKCSAVYTGRGDTKLNESTRAIIIKQDGAVSLHSDLGNKPLNYMGKGNVFTEENNEVGLIWRFDSRNENLTIIITELISDSSFDLPAEEEGLIRDGTENHLQAWLADNPEVIGSGYTLVQREYPTGNGPVDLLVKDADGNPIAVEVKRVAMIGAIGQVKRYVSALTDEDGDFADTPVKGIVVALDIRPNTLKLAEKRGIDCVCVADAWNARKTPADEVDTPEES